MSDGDQSQVATPSSPVSSAGSDTFLPSLVNVNQHLAPGDVRHTERALLGTPAPLSDKRWLDKNVPLGGSTSPTPGAVDEVTPAALVVGPPGADVVTVLSLVSETVVDGADSASDAVVIELLPAPVVPVRWLVDPPEPHPAPAATVSASAPTAATIIRRAGPSDEAVVSRNDTGVILPYPEARSNAASSPDGATSEGR